jgi:hypothetical protein
MSFSQATNQMNAFRPVFINLISSKACASATNRFGHVVSCLKKRQLKIDIFRSLTAWKRNVRNSASGK